MVNKLRTKPTIASMKQKIKNFFVYEINLSMFAGKWKASCRRVRVFSSTVSREPRDLLDQQNHGAPTIAHPMPLDKKKSL
jgi:hypothetical protein